MLVCVCFLINLETIVDSSATPARWLPFQLHPLPSQRHPQHPHKQEFLVPASVLYPLLLEDSEEPVRVRRISQEVWQSWRFCLLAGSPPSSCSGKHPHRALLGSAAQSAGTDHQQAFASHATLNSDSDLNRHCHCTSVTEGQLVTSLTTVSLLQLK